MDFSKAFERIDIAPLRTLSTIPIAVAIRLYMEFNVGNCVGRDGNYLLVDVNRYGVSEERVIVAMERLGYRPVVGDLANPE